MVTTFTTPRLAPLVIRRSRLDQWACAYKQFPVRLIVGPAGCGKTTFLRRYAVDGEATRYYCALPDCCDAATLYGIIARTLRSTSIPHSYSGLLDLITAMSSQCIELIVDDADNGDAQAIGDLRRLVDDAGDTVTFIYGFRSREALPAKEWISRGIGTLCNARSLAFDAQEAALFAEACGVAATDLEIRRLIEDTDGWALAVSAAVRTAAAEKEALSRAYERWRSHSASFLYDLVGAELERASAEDAEIFWGLFTGKTSASAQRMRQLESRGLLIVDRGGDEVQLYRPLQPAIVKPCAPSDTSFAPAIQARMFRSFEFTIGGRQIPWVRRRDQQIIKYLLLKPDGAASRLELAQVFWPETDRHLATQSVRTACSTIRKAFASVVGYADVDKYFRTSRDVQIDLANVVCDVRRFRTHLVDGDACVEQGEPAGAMMHYRAAEKLYAGRLLDFEAPEPWFVSHAHVLQDRYVMLLESLAEFSLDVGDFDSAQQYVNRAQVLAPDQPSVARLISALHGAKQWRPPTARVECAEIHGPRVPAAALSA